MPAPKDTQHDLVPAPGQTKEPGVPDGIDQGEAKGTPTGDRQASETVGGGESK